MTEKEFNSTAAGQKIMCHNGSVHATVTCAQKLLDKLANERRNLFTTWRDNGKTDDLWAPVAAKDAEIERMEDAVYTVRSHKI